MQRNRRVERRQTWLPYVADQLASTCWCCSAAAAAAGADARRAAVVQLSLHRAHSHMHRHVNISFNYSPELINVMLNAHNHSYCYTNGYPGTGFNIRPCTQVYNTRRSVLFTVTIGNRHMSTASDDEMIYGNTMIHIGPIRDSSRFLSVVIFSSCSWNRCMFKLIKLFVFNSALPKWWHTTHLIKIQEE